MSTTQSYSEAVGEAARRTELEDDRKIVLDNMLSHAENESPGLLQSMLDIPEGNASKHILLNLMDGKSASERLTLRDQVAKAMGGDARSFGEKSNLYLTADDVLTLNSEYGFSIGGHTRNHVQVGGITEAEAKEELTSSFQEIEEVIGSTVDTFSFPFGSP